MNYAYIITKMTIKRSLHLYAACVETLRSCSRCTQQHRNDEHTEWRLLSSIKCTSRASWFSLSVIFSVLQYQITRAASFPPLCIFLNGDLKHFFFFSFLPCTVTWWLTYLYRWNRSPGKAAAAGSLGQLGNNLISTHLNPRLR